MDQQQEQIQRVYNYVTQSLNNGNSREDVIQDLVNRGMPADTATAVVDQARPPKGVPRQRSGGGVGLSGGLVMMLVGVAMLVGGLLVTGYTYLTAETGDTYVVTTGLFVVGGLTIFRGLFRMMRGG
jgi:hypothetical protein